MECPYSDKTDLRRGQAVTCWNKQKRDLEGVSIGPCYCVATKLSNYSGHSHPDVDIELDRMKFCSYKKIIIPLSEKKEIEEAKEKEKENLKEIRKSLAFMTLENNLGRGYEDY